MKSKVFILAAALMTAACASAQKGIDNGTPYGSGADSLECIKNISLFIPYAKSNNFKDALPFWEKVYAECPASTKNVYVYGVDIIGWQISQATDATQKNALIDKLMKLYDDRVKYFGNDKKYGKDWIVSRKAQTYNQLKGDETDPTVIYQWTKEVLDEFKEKTEPLAISLYMFASFKQMQGDKEKYKEQYVNDFLKCTAYLDQAIAAQSDEKEKENILARKTEIEQNFAGSGAADCETLQSIYASKVEANKDNLDFLKETMTLLRRVGCKETDVYMAASEYAYKQEPTAESAMGLGGKAFKAGDYAAAEKYYNEAIGMTEDTDIKADLYFALAAMAASQNQYSKAKSLSLKCLEAKPSYGRAYILIAQLYSQGGRAAFPDDPVKAKLVFIAACDKAERARQVDPSVADEAAKLIRTYREYFPTKQEVFMHPELNEGADFSIGGWIGEKVKIRL
ncbi:MAG: tetratricopeptide repeat protein [Tannerella sp.]|jgi:tetratricopeptide (TPR) repeat protein|nr:tetratricopeptide repeat protein [Tannerella sp.]